jgi:hypothetical protein
MAGQALPAATFWERLGRLFDPVQHAVVKRHKPCETEQFVGSLAPPQVIAYHGLASEASLHTVAAFSYLFLPLVQHFERGSGAMLIQGELRRSVGTR